MLAIFPASTPTPQVVLCLESPGYDCLGPQYSHGFGMGRVLPGRKVTVVNSRDDGEADLYQAGSFQVEN